MKYGKSKRVIRAVLAVLMTVCMCFGLFGGIPRASAEIETGWMDVTSGMLKGDLRRISSRSLTGMLSNDSHIHFYRYDVTDERELELTINDSGAKVMTGIYHYQTNRKGEIDRAVLLSTATVNELSQTNKRVVYPLKPGKYLVGILTENAPLRSLRYDLSFRTYSFIREDSRHIEGSLSEEFPVSRWKFETFKTGKVTLTSNGVEVMGLNATVYDETGSKQIESTVMYSGRQKYDFYLQRGVYYLDLSVKDSYSKKYGKYGYDLQFRETYDSYEETNSQHNGAGGDPTQLYQMLVLGGTLTANEPAKTSDGYAEDIYCFNSYNASAIPELTVYGNFQTCSITVYRIENGWYHQEYSEEFGTGNDRHEGTVCAAASLPTLSVGEHFLKIRSKYTGEYTVSFQQQVKSTFSLPDMVLTVEDSSIIIQDSAFQRRYGFVDLSYEPSRPGFVRFGTGTVNGETISNTITADKGGCVTVAAYGNDRNGNLIRGFFNVTVEFTDVKHQEGTKDPYFYEPVYWAATEGITMGVMDKDGVYRRFNPQGVCTRAQMLTFLWRMADCPEPREYTDFPDVKSTDYFYKAVCWAQENGITKGYPDGTFKPQKECTRSQAVTFLYRYEGSPEIDPSASPVFKDIHPGDGSYYNDAVIWAVQNGITTGYASDNTFRPSGKCTRAQMVTFLFRDGRGLG